jgi:hypothetical protein
MRVIAYNPTTENLEKSYLAESYSAGTTSLNVRNSDHFAADKYLLIGPMGVESTEIVSCSNVAGNVLTVSATRFAHSADDPIYVLTYNQIKFYRSTTTVDGLYSTVATIDIDADNAQGLTYYDDPVGLSSYFYKISFYDSINAIESGMSDAIPGTSYSRRQLGYIINDFLIEVGDRDQQYMSVLQAISVMNECNDDLSSQSRRPYRTQKTKAVLNIEAGNDRISLPDDLLAVDRIRYNYVYGVTSRSDDIQIKNIQELEYVDWDNLAQTTDELQFAAIDEEANELVIYPTPTNAQTAKITLYYWRKFPEFDSLGDEIILPTPRAYKLFLSARFYRMRGLHDQSFLPLSDRYANDYGNEVVKLQRLNRLDKGSPMAMKPDTRHARGLRK